jgi:hypothetical protein
MSVRLSSCPVLLLGAVLFLAGCGQPDETSERPEPAGTPEWMRSRSTLPPQPGTSPERRTNRRRQTATAIARETPVAAKPTAPARALAPAEERRLIRAEIKREQSNLAAVRAELADIDAKLEAPGALPEAERRRLETRRRELRQAEAAAQHNLGVLKQDLSRLEGS